MREIVVADIGGTHARFARARTGVSGGPEVGPLRKYRVREFRTLLDCWRRYREEERDLPDAACFAVAAPLWADKVKLTNSDWTVTRSTLAADIGVRRLRILNDFQAVAYGVAHLPPERLQRLFGPDTPFPRDGAVTVLGPGTGLGVGLIAFDDGAPHPLATEGAHVEFAPLDARERAIRDWLAAKHGRVSTERLACGPGLVNIWQALHPDREAPADAELWAAALAGADEGAAEALDIFFRVLGSVAGDLALAHGPHAVVLAGGLAQRMRARLEGSGFHARFTAKGRYAGMMRSIPVRMAVMDEIGLFGAAAAFRA